VTDPASATYYRGMDAPAPPGRRARPFPQRLRRRCAGAAAHPLRL